MIVLLFPALATFDAHSRTATMRSSPARGEPRPSLLEVVIHSAPSGALATVLIRP